ncbi:MAG: class I SAM-dependent methyltransferase [Alphaproteobacteria bacterium]|nr:class I SAM-dependent methyltransferase [Alphaproteobacteria bacterium]
MHLSEAEREQRARFGQSYRRNLLPVMLRIEKAVCGCNYGGTSWATRGEIDDVAEKRARRPGQRLLDLGAGSGWPGLYLAASSGCDITLVDLPAEGLVIAAARAKADRLAGVLSVAAADGRALPYGDKRFDAITHSDVLCCLPGKQAVLAECRRTVADKGRMIFSVISVAPDLSEIDRARAIETGPPYVASAIGYGEMFERTGWETVETVDLMAQFLKSATTFLEVDRENRADLAELLGEEDYEQRLQKDRDLIDAITRGILRRDLHCLRAG